MVLIPVICPQCGFSREVAEEKIPSGSIRVTCPDCKLAFVFNKNLNARPEKSFSQQPDRAMPNKTSPDNAKTSQKDIPAYVKMPRAEPASRGEAVKKEVMRGRKKIVAAMLSIILLIVIAASVYAHIFKIYPVIAEKALIAGLFTNYEPVQKFSIKKLRGYPTKHTAVSLVLFINLKNMRRMPDPKKPESSEEKIKREREHAKGLKLAERAAETLCLLSDENFNTYFKKEPHGHSWGSIDEGRWPRVLWAMNIWAVKTFGPADFPSLNMPIDATQFDPAKNSIQEPQK